MRAVRIHGGGNRDGFRERGRGECPLHKVVGAVLHFIVLRLAPGDNLVALGVYDEDGAVHGPKAAEHVVDFLGEEHVLLGLDVYGIYGVVFRN